MKLPMMPSDAAYNDMKNVDDSRVLVYNKGAWYLRLKSDMSEYKIGAV